MCYSAMIRSLERHHERVVDQLAFEDLFRRRLHDRSIVVSKSMEAPYDHPQTEVELRIKQSIDAYREQMATKYEAELFTQRTRLVNAQRLLSTKTTKKALEDQRVAAKKIEWCRGKLADLHRTEPKPGDARIFPFWYAPVIVSENGQQVIRPMRYHCRQADKPASYDKRFDGLYNARRDNLERFWRGQFGTKHAILVVSSFFENVPAHRAEHRELAPGEEPQNVVLHFNPQTGQDMLLACLWDRWQAPGQPDLYSFAAITDDPPPEVAAAGHDRCVIPIDPAHVDAWLNPQNLSKQQQYAILDQRERPYYEHRIAA